MGKGNELIDIIGQRFGSLTVVERAGKDHHKQTLWLCQCDCGRTKVVRSYSLRSGGTSSCGCRRGEYKKSNDSCPYNDSISCNSGENRCKNCGWNPKIATKRIADYIRRSHDH